MMYTVYAEYGATGEGQTVMVLFTRAFPHGPDWNDSTKDSKYWALQNFKKIFGEFYASGAEVHEGVVFNLYGIDQLISESLRKSMNEWEKNGGFEYHVGLHLNLS